MTAPRRWPLFLIAAPAAVAIWSGWVGLGQLCGFGLVRPLPGIWDGLRLDTAITLPVGVEAYGAYALGAWLSLGADHPARKFARRSAVGSLLLGMLGQVAYHLIVHAGLHKAPALVVVLVSCLPVVTLGFGAALTHLLRGAGDEMNESSAHAVPEPDPAPEAEAPAPGPDAGLDRLISWLTEAVPGVPDPAAGLNGHAAAAAELFAADVAAGRVPGIRAIRSGLHVGQDKASQVQAYLRALARTP